MRELKRTAIACALALSAASLCAALALAQDTDEDVIVQAPRPSDQRRVRAFVGSLTPSVVQPTLPRWTDRLCTGIIGMQSAYARAVNDRIARVAHRYDLQTGEPGCDPNVIIYFTPDPDTVAAMVTSRPGEPQVTPPATNGPQRPIRWWHLTGHSVDGIQLERDGSATDADSSADSSDETRIRNGVRVRDVSRIRGNAQTFMIRVAIVIDSRAMDHVHLGALSDFIAMVTLAQINPDADVSDAPTVLNLFQLEDPPLGLTGWDFAYLDALYTSRDDPRDVDQQQRLMVRDMVYGARDNGGETQSDR